MQQPTAPPPGVPPQPPPAVITRISTAGLSLALGATVLVLGLIMWPIHAMMLHRKLAYMQMRGGSYLHHAGAYAGMHAFGPLHILVAAVLAGVAGFVFAAVYNSIAASRPN
jgi:hypothetical protein